MKELKFRIWIKDEKRYYDESDEESYMIVPNGNVTYTSEAYEENGAWFTDTTSATDDVIVEQYTGLKDKNGKEIYEGDIVKINGWWDAAGPAGYGKNLCAIKWDEEITGFAPFNVYDCDCSVYHYAEDCEVIGNIHENPELLGEEEE